MRKRTRVVVAAFGLVGIAIGGVAALVALAISTDWGNERVRGLIESNVGKRLAPGAVFRMGGLKRHAGGAWVADSVLLTDSSGRAVVSIARVSASLALPSFLRGDIRLGTVIIEGARFTLEQGPDGTWNTTRLFATRVGAAPATTGFGRGVVADSLELRDGRLDLTMPDSRPTLPPVRRVFSDIAIASGPTTLLGGDGAGRAPRVNLSLALDDPPVVLRSATGSIQWWPDSLDLNFPEFRLPATRASVTGSVAWSEPDGARLRLDVVADTIAPADIRWMSTLIPTEGDASARVAIRTDPRGEIRYEITQFDLRAFDSRVSGSFAVTPGQQTEVRNLVLVMAPLDFRLVRNIFGDTILKPAWQGAIDGRLVASGGRLDSLAIDTVAATFRDARIGGAASRVFAAGAVDAAGDGTRLIGFGVRLDSLDIRTLGAVVHLADSLPGALKGTVILDGPTSNLNFRDLEIRHVNGDQRQSVASGSGRIASDLTTQWLEARLTLDTVALALIQPDSPDMPLDGYLSGTLVLSAIGDTMSIDTRLASAGGSVHLTGTTLLDSTRTRMEIGGTVSGVDPRRFLVRRDIPALSLSGRVRLALDDSNRGVDRRLDVHLDSTSRVGDSPLVGATLRFAQDSTGIHLDTADVRAATWTVNAQGRLAASGTSATDSITFSTEFTSLAEVRTLLLDSTGAPRFRILEGQVKTDSGVIRGSFERAHVFTRFGAQALQVDSATAALVIGRIALDDAPKRATGEFHGRVVQLAAGGMQFDSATVEAHLMNGDSARVAGRVVRGDSTEVTLGAAVTWPDSTYRVHLDSLDAKILTRRWRLAMPATIVVRPSAVSVDSLVLRGEAGDMIVAAGSLPETGAIGASVRVRNLGFDELAMLGIVPPGIRGVISASAQIGGTRDAPTISASAVLDSIRSEGREHPSVTADGTYAAKRANVTVMVLAKGERVLEARGDLPLDLTLRSVSERIIDAPMSLKLRADSLGLGLFEGLLPRVSGLGGYITSDVDVGGTLRHPRGSGSLALYGGTFDLRRFGVSAEDASAVIRLAGDSVIVERLRMSDGDSRADTVSLTGIVHLTGRQWTEWGVAMKSVANNFRVIDDPRLATAEADWNLDITGRLAEPRVTGEVQLPRALFTIGPQRRPRTVTAADSLAEISVATPNLDGVLVSLGSDVRLRSRDANVQLAGELELFGPLTFPWISGSVSATRGTYRVNVGGVIARTFRVDSGSVVLEGTPDMPPALDIYTQYVVRRPTEDVVIRAHLYGTTDRPRLDLSSELGSTASQSEIISYLVFGQPSFAVQPTRDAALRQASIAFLPTLGGYVERFLGTIMPFFSTLQVTSTLSEDAPGTLIQNPIETTLNSYAVTGGRQIGSDTFFSLSAGRCGASGVSSSNAPIWGGTSIEYRPKRSLGVSLAIDPGPAPCTRVSAASTDRYQFGLDLSYDWRFGRKP